MRSPDVADALALTLAAPVSKLAEMHRHAKTNYDVWGVR